MSTLILFVFIVVYLGMFAGGLPKLALDRTGVALLGALVLIAAGALSPSNAWQAIDVSTMTLLFGLMVVSAQLRLGGFYTRITRQLALSEQRPEMTLALVMTAAALLSSLLANDIVCLAMAPILIDGCARKKLNPKPFLLGLALAANIGSAATLIGNPQNMLIGQSLQLSFSAYLFDALVPVVLGMVVAWWLLVRSVRGAWGGSTPLPTLHAPTFNRWQTSKGLLVISAVTLAFLLTPWPRETIALAAAALLLTSRRMASRDFLGLVDWQLLILFSGLFIVNKAVADAGLLTPVIAGLSSAGFPLHEPLPLFISTVLLSNLVSNVPAVMLLLPVATEPLAGPILALASTLAGNFFIIGSIANIIVVEQARTFGVIIGWREHARIGIPVTLVTLAISALWLWLRS
jgi:Na+/H+ antiporter NhaD/arsenite permease-like protein